MSRTIRLPAVALAASFATLVGAAGCSDADFERSTEITKFRALSIIATPPEVAPGETTVLEPVFAFPRALVPPTHFEWTLCLFDEGANGYFRCADDIPELGVTTTLATSTDRSFVFTQDVLSESNLQAACAALANVGAGASIPPEIASGLPKCSTGLPLRVRLKVCEVSGCEDREAFILSTKLTLLFDAYRDRPDRNVAPTMNAIWANDALLVENAPTPLMFVGEGADDEMPLTIRIDVPASAAQSFTPVEPAGAPAEREELQMHWYATAGEWKRSRSFYREGITNDAEIGGNELTLARADLVLPQTIEIWAVLRDSRGAVATLYRQVVVE